MKPQPLPKAIYEKAQQLDVTSIGLEFSGGNDEGRLYVRVVSPRNYKELSGLEKQIENWAWEAYFYSGAGVGTDYGDDITYDLENSKVTTSSWEMVRKDHEKTECEFKVSAGD